MSISSAVSDVLFNPPNEIWISMTAFFIFLEDLHFSTNLLLLFFTVFLHEVFKFFLTVSFFFLSFNTLKHTCFIVSSGLCY